MDLRLSKMLTVLILLTLCQLFGKSFSASIFGLNFGSLRNAAENRIEKIPKLLHRINLFNRPQASATYPDNLEFNNNRRLSYPFATDTLNPTQNENSGKRNPAHYPDNEDNSNYNGRETIFSPALSKYVQKQDSDSNSPILFDNPGTDYSGHKNVVNRTPNKNLQGYPFIPHTSDAFNNVTPGKNLNHAGSLAPVKIDSRGSHNVEENSKPLQLSQYNAIKKNPASQVVSEQVTVTSDTDVNAEYTTETSDYDWTTTDEPLNRIGGAPPAVVASLLG